MTAQLDLERVVTEWLRADASASGSDRVLTATLDRISTVRQERRRLPWPTWRRPQMSPTLSMAMVAAAVVVVAVAGVNLLSPNRDRGGNVPLGPTPVPESTPTHVPNLPRRRSPTAGDRGLRTDQAHHRSAESTLAGCWETTTAGRVDPVWWASFGGDRAIIGAHPGGIGITTADTVPPAARFPDVGPCRSHDRRFPGRALRLQSSSRRPACGTRTWWSISSVRRLAAARKRCSRCGCSMSTVSGSACSPGRVGGSGAPGRTTTIGRVGADRDDRARRR